MFRRLVGTVRINALRVNILENRPDLGTYSALAKIIFHKDDKNNNIFFVMVGYYINIICKNR